MTTEPIHPDSPSVPQNHQLFMITYCQMLIECVARFDPEFNCQSFYICLSIKAAELTVVYVRFGEDFSWFICNLILSKFIYPSRHHHEDLAWPWTPSWSKILILQYGPWPNNDFTLICYTSMLVSMLVTFTQCMFSFLLGVRWFMHYWFILWCVIGFEVGVIFNFNWTIFESWWRAHKACMTNNF